MKHDPRASSCTRDPFWVDAGEAPKEPRAIDPKILAELAYQQTQVPDTQVEMNPQGKQTVNLATWVWLDSAKYEPVKVRATIPGTGLRAVTTAKPVSLHLDAGTQDAELHPASGECPISKNGTIGAPYTKGSSKETPPCGLTYLRSSNGEPYEFTATLTWDISWKGSGGTSGDLPDGTFKTTQEVTVQEIQSIVR